jgi:hypothetical protein
LVLSRESAPEPPFSRPTIAALRRIRRTTSRACSPSWEAWLNRSDLVERAPEVVPGYPDRIVPISPKAAAVLKKRTLTNLERAAAQR